MARRNKNRQGNAGRTDREHARDDRRYGELLVAKGVFTDDEFKAQLSTERANYLAVLKRLH